LRKSPVSISQKDLYTAGCIGKGRRNARGEIELSVSIEVPDRQGKTAAQNIKSNRRAVKCSIAIAK